VGRLRFYGQRAANQQVLEHVNLTPNSKLLDHAVLDGINQHLNVMAVPSFGYFMFRNFTTPIPDGNGNPLGLHLRRHLSLRPVHQRSVAASARGGTTSPRATTSDSLNSYGKQQLKDYTALASTRWLGVR